MSDRADSVLLPEAGIVADVKKLGTTQITVLVVAAAAPLSTVIATCPIGMMLGNGAGLAGAFLLAGILMFSFAIGYSALIKAKPGAGAFFYYISEIFGNRAATGAAWIAMASYLAITIGLAVGTGYFADITLKSLGLDLGWQICTALGIGFVAILGYANSEFAARLIVPMVAVELMLLAALATAIVADKGLSSFPLPAISPEMMIAPGMGISLMIAICGFSGVESASLYNNEARNPTHTIPRATKVAVAIIAIAYFTMIWIVVGDLGWATVKDQATAAQGDLMLNVFRVHLGSPIAAAVSVLLCTSNFACFLALHNASARYTFIAAEGKQLPRILARTNRRFNAPSNASLAVTVLVSVVVLSSALSGFDPYVYILPIALAIATIGIVGVQTIVSAGVLVYFRKQRDKRVFTTLIAPGIAFVGLCGVEWLIWQNYSILTGSDSMLVNSTPIALILMFIYGYSVAKRKS